MTVAPEEKTRVDFNAPTSLVERADAIADLLGTSRTQLLVEALRAEIDNRVADEAFRDRIKAAYYADRIDLHVVEAVLGTDAATRMRLLRESVDRDPPEPSTTGKSVSAAEFYDGVIPSWDPNDNGANGSEEPASESSSK